MMRKSSFITFLAVIGILFSSSLLATETAQEEAIRRVPPVLSSLMIPGKLISGQPHTITWSLTGYENNYKTIIAFFDCSGLTSPGCGNSYSDPKLVASSKLSPESVDIGDWSYLGTASSKLNYSFTFTPSVTVDTQTVIRFYYIGGADDIGGKSTISLIAPGNLPNVIPYDTSGRRLSTTVFAEGSLAAGAPKISPIEHETVLQNGVLSKIVVVADLETSSQNLTVLATSSDQTLVPATNIFIGGNGSNRVVTIVPATGQLGTATITVMVRDGEGNVSSSSFEVNVTLPTITIANATVTEGDTGSVNADFLVVLNQTSNQAVSVDYATSPAGNTTEGADYTATSGTLTFAPGETTRTISVPVLGDLIDEPNETFTVTLNNASNATISNAAATGTITDNDPEPTVSFSSDAQSQDEGNLVTVTLQLSAVSGIDVAVPFTVSGTATSADYTGLTVSPVTIPAGSTSVNITFTAVDDSTSDADETVVLTVGTPTYATVGATGVHTVTIGEEVSGDFENTLGMTFNLIPAGTFTMGSPDTEAGRLSDEGPQHQVTISQPFYMQTTEVTQGQWQAVMGSNPSYFSSCGTDCPVETVSWDDIQTFLTTTNQRGEGTYRLPTEAEWEYAARAGTTTAYSFGDSSSSLGSYGWYSSNASSTTHTVASKLPNPWGLYDMHGNVWERVSDWYSSSYYTSTAATDPQGAGSGSHRVIRGGNWSYDASFPRSANRYTYGSPGDRSHHIGFRLVKVIPLPQAHVPKTGQTTSYAAGDDGASQKGVAWPDPRFTDNGDGTVTDNLTDLVWLKNANCFEGQAWADALASSNALASGTCGLTDGSVAEDWRLPSINEMGSLITAENFEVLENLPDYLGRSGLPSGHPFTGYVAKVWPSGNIAIPLYWSSTTDSLDTSEAWMVSGLSVRQYTKSSSDMYTWPVRGTHTVSTPSPVLNSGQTVSYGNKDDGALQKGFPLPTTRFTDLGDGTVKDELTGLVWLKDADCFGNQTWSVAVSSSNTLSSGSCGLSDDSVSGDWRLSNREELSSLLDYGHSDPAIPSNHPFNNIVTNNVYWSSTSSALNSSSPSQLLYGYVIINNGIVDFGVDTARGSWPVRDE